jgi:hypothetical protein
MKYIKLILSSTISFLILITSCKNEQNLLLTDKEWENILNYTISLPSISERLVNSNYCNKRTYDLISFCYENSSSELDYELTDSIRNYLKVREDEPIKNRIDTLFGISFINKNETLEKEHLIFSEPFFIKKDLLCFSIELIGIKDKPLNQWVFFLQNKDKRFMPIRYYDYLDAKFYEFVKITPKMEKD